MRYIQFIHTLFISIFTTYTTANFINKCIIKRYDHTSHHSICSPEFILHHISIYGWKDSNIRIEKGHTRGHKCISNHCNGNGENLLGKCFCLPGWSGPSCTIKTNDFTQSDHVNKNDKCFYTSDGVWAVSPSRWNLAREAEAALWDIASIDVDSSVGDRVEEHKVDFNGYKAVAPDGSNLGSFIEVGAGPWTQSLGMLQERNYSVSRYVLLDPNALSYAAHVKSCPYRTGRVNNIAPGGATIINAGAEHLDLMFESFDALMIVNVLEHVENAVKVLRNTYNALKPGGTLIFHERWWDNYTPPDVLDLDALLHPIRVRESVVDSFLSGFDSLYEKRGKDVRSFSVNGRNFTGVYFIGKKRNIC